MRPGKETKRTNTLQDEQGRDEDEHDIHGHIQRLASGITACIHNADVKKIAETFDVVVILVELLVYLAGILIELVDDEGM